MQQQVLTVGGYILYITLSTAMVAFVLWSLSHYVADAVAAGMLKHKLTAASKRAHSHNQEVLAFAQSVQADFPELASWIFVLADTKTSNCRIDSKKIHIGCDEDILQVKLGTLSGIAMAIGGHTLHGDPKQAAAWYDRYEALCRKYLNGTVPGHAATIKGLASKLMLAEAAKNQAIAALEEYRTHGPIERFLRKHVDTRYTPETFEVVAAELALQLSTCSERYTKSQMTMLKRQNEQQYAAVIKALSKVGAPNDV